MMDLTLNMMDCTKHDEFYSELDSAVERLLLATYGVPEPALPVNSLFFFTSDNGPSLRNEVLQIAINANFFDFSH